MYISVAKKNSLIILYKLNDWSTNIHISRCILDTLMCFEFRYFNRNGSVALNAFGKFRTDAFDGE